MADDERAALHLEEHGLLPRAEAPSRVSRSRLSVGERLQNPLRCHVARRRSGGPSAAPMS
jgi:hypothetical protein